MPVTISAKVGTYREANPENNSVARLSEVIFDRMSSSAISQRALISSYTGVLRNSGMATFIGIRTHRFRQGVDSLG